MPKRKPTRTEAELRRQRDAAVDTARNASQVIVATRVERDTALRERDIAQRIAADAHVGNERLKEANDHLADTMQAMEMQHRQKKRQLFRLVFDLQLQSAFREGYIARVLDLDPPESRSGITASAATGDDLPNLRDLITGATSEAQRDSIIDSVDTETLDQVLGREAQTDRFIQP